MIIFLDDILVYSTGEAKHAKHHWIVLQALRNHHFYARFSKCYFWMEGIMFLEYIVNAVGMSVNSSKVFAIVEWLCLPSVSKVCSFLGLVGYYRQFV